MGAVWFTGTATGDAAVRVLPGIERLRTLVAPARTQAAVGPRRSSARGDGLELAEVRPWVPGDHARRLHWRATARRGEPFVAERHPERAADVLIFVDTFADLPSPPAREGALTLAVRAAAGLAEAHLRVRDRVGVVTFGGVLHWLAPGAGVAHALRIADALASSEVFMSYVAHDVAMVPPAILPSRALVLAITPLLDERGARALLDLCARGHDVTVIEIDAPALLGARARPGHAPVDAAPRGDARAAGRARRDDGDLGRRAPPGGGARGGDGIPARIAARGARLALALAALAVAAAVALSALLTEPTGAGRRARRRWARAARVRHPAALAGALAALGVAAASRSTRAPPSATAPLWGAGAAGGRRAGRARADAARRRRDRGRRAASAGSRGSARWPASALAAGALVLLAATTSAGTTVAGLAAGAVLAVVPAVLARRRTAQGGRGAG